MFGGPLFIFQYSSVEMYTQHLFCRLFQQSKERRYNVTLWGFYVMLMVLRHPNSLIPFHLKRMLIWRFNVTVNNKMYWGFHVKCPILTKFGVSQEICMKVSNVQGGSNMTGTDLYVNKPHYAAAVRPWESEATTSTLPLARVRTCSVLSGSC